jgi:diguanylate cyclase (GGDEF)-like protein
MPATFGKFFAQPYQKLSPARIALLYAFVGIVWILFSDTATAWLVKDLQQFEHVAIFKGILFVIVTSGLMFLLVHYYARQLRSFQEISHRAEQEIEKLAYYDNDTGLPNSNLLLDRLNQTMALNSRQQENTVIIYISVTGYKTVVDARGHGGGREASHVIAERLGSTLRQCDTIARVHRDEFVILLGGTIQENDAAIVLKKLLKVFSEPFRLGTEEAMIPACFGIACFPADGMTSELLLQNAHIAMNQARQNGLTYQYYSEALNRKAVERHNIESGLLRALDNGEFFLCYQPKLDINGKDIIGMEALVRWRNSEHTIIPPDKFIPVAEENGLIVGLGRFVLLEACRQNKAWQDAGLPKLCVAVNISARQLQDNSFVPLVMQILVDTGLDPHYLELELTESLLMSEDRNSLGKILRLKELGISISVDDFGTGYSSLSYLKHLPIDTIKIDRSFVRDIVTDADDAAIVEAIITMAHSLRLNVIAEGVESLEQLEFLRQRNCHQAQGYFFSKPLAPHHFEYFLRTGTTSVATSGTLNFVFTPGFSSFEGIWSYHDQPDWNNLWNGVLEGPEQNKAVRSYKTNYGTLRLVFEGETVSGSYTHNDGSIEGVMKGYRLTGTWLHNSHKEYVPPIPAKTEESLLLWQYPSPMPIQEQASQPNEPQIEVGSREEFIGEIAIRPDPVLPDDTIPAALNRFQSDPGLHVLPVVEQGMVIGIINRSTFLEEHVIGRHGFGIHINYSKKLRDLMAPVELKVESSTTIEEAAKLIQASRQSLTRMDNICVIADKEYFGIVNVNKLFDAITNINLAIAKGASPLTGLPGNESIQREITGRMAQKSPFDIGYIDIDNFKPYNDCYGFQKGDIVIKTLGEALVQVLDQAGTTSFRGHIGGDDFIVITEPHQAENISYRIIEAFEKNLPIFHGEQDFSAGCYSATNRKGEQETFGLLSISIGIVNTHQTPVTSYPQLASLSTEVKKAAKKLPGSSVVVNRRNI